MLRDGVVNKPGRSELQMPIAFLTFADDRSSLPLCPLRCQHGWVTFVLSPLLDSREHWSIPKHVRHDAKDDLVSADIELLQRGRLPPDVRFDTVLFVRNTQE